jgi:hypothetical protein
MLYMIPESHALGGEGSALGGEGSALKCIHYNNNNSSLPLTKDWIIAE